MNNLTINPEIANNEIVKIVIEAYSYSGTTHSIDDLVSGREDIPTSVESYLRSKYKRDKYDIQHLIMDFLGEVLWVIETRVEHTLGFPCEVAYDFTEWLTGAHGYFPNEKSIMHSALVGAFTGNLDDVDRAFDVYNNIKKVA